MSFGSVLAEAIRKAAEAMQNGRPVQQGQNQEQGQDTQQTYYRPRQVSSAAAKRKQDDTDESLVDNEQMANVVMNAEQEQPQQQQKQEDDEDGFTATLRNIGLLPQKAYADELDSTVTTQDSEETNSTAQRVNVDADTQAIIDRANAGSTGNMSQRWDRPSASMTVTGQVPDSYKSEESARRLATSGDSARDEYNTPTVPTELSTSVSRQNWEDWNAARGDNVYENMYDFQTRGSMDDWVDWMQNGAESADYRRLANIADDATDEEVIKALQDYYTDAKKMTAAELYNTTDKAILDKYFGDDLRANQEMRRAMLEMGYSAGNIGGVEATVNGTDLTLDEALALSDYLNFARLEGDDDVQDLSLDDINYLLRLGNEIYSDDPNGVQAQTRNTEGYTVADLSVPSDWAIAMQGANATVDADGTTHMKASEPGSMEGTWGYSEDPDGLTLVPVAGMPDFLKTKFNLGYTNKRK